MSPNIAVLLPAVLEICVRIGHMGEVIDVRFFEFLRNCFSQTNYSEVQAPNHKAELPAALRNFIVVDVETTGLSPNDSEIIQLSAVHYLDGKEKESFATYIRPSVHIPTRITEITGISDATVSNAPLFASVQKKYFDFIGKAPVVTGYNVSFDIRFLSAASGISLFSKWTYFDTLKYTRLCCPGLPEYKLESVCGHINFKTDFHNALNDCRACASVLFYMCQTSYELLDDCLTLQTPTSTSHTSTVNSHVQADWDKWLDSGFPYWLQGETERCAGRIDEAIEWFDRAKSGEYVAAMLYESYAKIYRKQKDYVSEIQILDEGISRLGKEKCQNLIIRRDKTIMRLKAQNTARLEEEGRAYRRAERAARKLKEQEDAVANPREPSCRAILQMDDDGNVLKEFPSIAAAERECNINSKSLRNAANGIQKHAGGYRWKFKDEEETQDIVFQECLEEDVGKTKSFDARFLGQTFVFTGTLRNFTRDEAADLIEKHGGQAFGSISERITFVVAGDDPGRKLERARDLGLTILTEDEFLALLN